jgi:hypothetical protein
MDTLGTDEMVDVITQIRRWPPERKLALVQEVLTELTYDLKSSLSERKPLSNLIGILKTDAPPPNDVECEQIRDEELRKKYG